MMRILFTIIFFGFLPGGIFAQTKTPRFEDFAVSTRFNGKAARVNLRSHPQAGMFRTMLRDAVKKGAAFAGHYAVNRWGCGTNCIRIGIVDLKTGRAYVAPFYASYGVSYRVDSKLLITEQPDTTDYFGDDPDRPKPRYYVWRENRLILIYPKQARNDEAENFWQ